MAKSNGIVPKDDVRTCKECKIDFPNIYAYTEHLESKDHIKGVMKQKYGKKYLEAKAKLDAKTLDKTENPDKMLQAVQESSKTAKKASKNIENVISSANSMAKGSSSSEDDSEDDEVYTCVVCKNICTGLLSYQLHLEGKKHQKNVKKVNLLKEMKEQRMLPETNNEPKEENFLDQFLPKSRHISFNLACKICKKKCLGPEAYKQHCKSTSHAKKVAMEELLKGMETEGLCPNKDDDNDGESFAHCDICYKEFSGPVPYMQHMKSDAHFKQEARTNQLGKIQNLIISKEEDSKLKCKDCGKMFSGPIPFNTHLKSSAHGKMKKRNALIDNLEKKHPELIKTLTKGNSDDSDEEDSIQLACKVCHVVFSGPESANDHFTSPKHKKAIQKRAMFKKFKKQQKDEKLFAISDGDKNTTKSESEDALDFEEEFDIINEP